MKKVIATLITGVFAASVFAASPTPAPTTATAPAPAPATPAVAAAASADVKSAVAEKKNKAVKVVKEKMTTEAKAPAAAVK